MADPSRVQTLSGESALATVTVTHSAAGAGNLLVLIAATGAYKSGDPSGYTTPTGGSQQTFLGHYLWYKVAAGGETSVAYTIGSAVPSAYIFLEYNNVTVSPYDVSNGQLAATNDNTYTTPAVTPTAGRRVAIATIAGSRIAPGSTTQSTWLNSYTEVADVFTTNGSGDSENVAAAELILTGDNSTPTSSGSTYSFGPDARTGIIAVFKGQVVTWTQGVFARIGG